MPENENKIAGSCWGGISIAAANNLRQNDIKSRQNNKPIKCMRNFEKIQENKNMLQQVWISSLFCAR